MHAPASPINALTSLQAIDDIEMHGPFTQHFIGSSDQSSAEAHRGAAGNARRARATNFVLSFRSNSTDLRRFQVLILFVASQPRLNAIKIKIDHRSRVECK